MPTKRNNKLVQNNITLEQILSERYDNTAVRYDYSYIRTIGKHCGSMHN